MRQCHTAAMEVCSPLQNGEFALEPYEAGWATEALAIVYIREVHGEAPILKLKAQISADGCRWIDFGPAFAPINSEGGYFLRLEGFGNWLRLAGEVSGGPAQEAAFIADFYWALKE